MIGTSKKHKLLDIVVSTNVSALQCPSSLCRTSNSKASWNGADRIHEIHYITAESSVRTQCKTEVRLGCWTNYLSSNSFTNRGSILGLWEMYSNQTLLNLVKPLQFSRYDMQRKAFLIMSFSDYYETNGITRQHKVVCPRQCNRCQLVRRVVIPHFITQNGTLFVWVLSSHREDDDSTWIYCSIEINFNRDKANVFVELKSARWTSLLALHQTVLLWWQHCISCNIFRKICTWWCALNPRRLRPDWAPLTEWI